MHLTLIDNYDSFTYNIVHALGMTGADVQVVRNDALSADDVLAGRLPEKGRTGGGPSGNGKSGRAAARPPHAIVISPGPCTPLEAGISLAVIAKAAQANLPLLGICLGHQAIGQAFGGKVVRTAPMHGKVSAITHTGEGLFTGLPNPLAVTRYHSLVVEAQSLPAELVVDAKSADGLIMALRHTQKPIYGVQFHPESIATAQGAQLFATFIALAKAAPTRQS